MWAQALEKLDEKIRFQETSSWFISKLWKPVSLVVITTFGGAPVRKTRKYDLSGMTVSAKPSTEI